MRNIGNVYIVCERRYDEGFADCISLVTADESDAKSKLDTVAKSRKAYGDDPYSSRNPYIQIWRDGVLVSEIELKQADMLRLGLKDIRRRRETGELIYEHEDVG